MYGTYINYENNIIYKKLLYFCLNSLFKDSTSALKGLFRLELFTTPYNTLNLCQKVIYLIVSYRLIKTCNCRNRI